MNCIWRMIELYGCTMKNSSKFKKFDVIAFQARMFNLPCLHPQRVTFKEHNGKSLITPRGVLVFPSCFCFTLRTMLNLSLGAEFKNVAKIQLLYLLICFSYFFSCLDHLHFLFLYLCCLFCVAYE